MRRVLAITLIPVAAIALAACSSGPGGSATSAAPCAATPSGSASDAVTVNGDFGTPVTVELEGDLDPASTERSVPIEGSGEPAQPGQTVNVYYSVFRGSTGEKIESGLDLSAEPTPFVLDETVFISGLVKTLGCSTPDSRVVGVIPPDEAFGDMSAQLGLEEGEALIFVADVVSVEDTPEQTPEPVPSVDLPQPGAWTDNIPTVDLAASPPVVTIPDAAPPAELVLTVLEEGDGDVVPNGANVTVDYQGTSWDSKQVFDQSFDAQPATFPTSGVIKGFAAGIVGQQVGSTVLVSIPPALAYGEDPAAHELGGQTLVFLITIHGYE